MLPQDFSTLHNNDGYYCRLHVGNVVINHLRHFCPKSNPLTIAYMARLPNLSAAVGWRREESMKR